MENIVRESTLCGVFCSRDSLRPIERKWLPPGDAISFDARLLDAGDPSDPARVLGVDERAFRPRCNVAADFDRP